MKKRILSGCMAVAAVVVAAGSASAQTAAVGPRPTQFPDVIVSGVGASTTDFLYYGTLGGISSYAMGSVSCNIATSGSWPAIWIDGAGTFGNQHPVIGGQIYRLFDNRFEQIGMSWLKHGFCAADAPSCTNLANPGTTVPSASNPSCDWLGTGQTDTYSAGLNGAQGSLGSRSEVNAWTGQFPYPYVLGSTGSFNCLGKRLQVRKADLDPAQYPGATYWGEVVYICTDEWEGQRLNQYSYRQINRPANTQTSATGGAPTCTTESGYNLSFSGATIPKKAAIEQWKVADPTVKLVYGMAPNDGQFAVASKVIDRGNGTWRYEYAVMNLNSHRSGVSFSIPKAASGVTITEQAFYAPTYHSGDPYSATPWTMGAAGNSVSWNTDSFATNPNANALRWSTVYNFRFVADRPPTTGSATIGLFRPAIVPGDADAVSFTGLDVPSNPPTCAADFNGANGVTVQDIFDYLAAWFAGTPNADFNGANGVTVQDIFDYLAAWFAGCP